MLMILWIFTILIWTILSRLFTVQRKFGRGVSDIYPLGPDCVSLVLLQQNLRKPAAGFGDNPKKLNPSPHKKQIFRYTSTYTLLKIKNILCLYNEKIYKINQKKKKLLTNEVSVCATINSRLPCYVFFLCMLTINKNPNENKLSWVINYTINWVWATKRSKRKTLKLACFNVSDKIK